jgi:hypothetical protein
LLAAISPAVAGLATVVGAFKPIAKAIKDFKGLSEDNKESQKKSSARRKK